MNARKPRICCACGEGTLHPHSELTPVEIDGKTGSIRLHHSVCDVCGAHLTDANEMLLNRRAWNKFRKEVGEIPTGAEIAAMRNKHKLTQAFAGRLFGGGPVAFSKYENDDVIPDEAMVGLLKLAIQYPDTIERLVQVKQLSTLTNRRLLSNIKWGGESGSAFPEQISVFNEIVDETFRLVDFYPIGKIGEISWNRK